MATVVTLLLVGAALLLLDWLSGYRAAHGYTMDAPFNKEREFL